MLRLLVYDFHASIHPLPEHTQHANEVLLRGQTFASLASPSPAIGLPLAFERVEQSLVALPRMFFEPDGSFVWVGQAGARRWQVDGELYDGGATLAYAELRGRCPGDAFDQLLAAFDWPDTALMFQLTREAVYLEETAFRRYAALAGPMTSGTSSGS